MNSESHLPVYLRLRFAWVVISLLVIGGLLIVLSAIPAGQLKLSDIVQNLLLHAGIAALVALFLAVTVDIYLKYELSRSVSRSVFEAVFRQIIPAEIVGEVTENIIRQPILRRNQHVDISLRRTSTSHILMATYRFRYELNNLTGHNQPIMIAHDFWRPIMKGFEEEVYFEEMSISTPTEDYHYSGALLDKHVRIGKSGIRFSTIIILGPRQTASVKGVVRQAVWDRDWGPWFVRQPTINFSVQYDHDEDLVVQVTAAHPASPTRLERVSPTQWILRGGILPFQGLIFSWRPKESQAEEL